MTTAALSYDPAASYPVRARHVEYRTDGTRSWLATIYEPQGDGPFPAIMEIHGGHWDANDRLQNAGFDAALAATGLVVVAPDFHSSSEAPYPASMQDINHATRWFKAHASEFNATAEALGGIGFSSGGHLVMLMAMRPQDQPYGSLPLEGSDGLNAGLAYVIMAWPVIDPYSRYVFAGGNNRPDLVHAAFQYFGDEAGMKEASPQHILERGERVEMPPALLVQGAADAAITQGMAEAFALSYSTAGGVIELAKYPGAPHGFAREPGENTRRAVGLIKSFVARQLEEARITAAL